MIRINQIKLPINHRADDIAKQIMKKCRLGEQDFTYSISKQSIDARDKSRLRYIYSVDVSIKKGNKTEQQVVKAAGNRDVMLVTEKKYVFPQVTMVNTQDRPIIVGTGPAGLFAGLMLARAGKNPILLERGDAVEQRMEKVEHFWRTNELDEESNIQFGEGGAGTFSDGKLNTGVKDKDGRLAFVLETFIEFGAPEEIRYSNKPHIGTDILCDVVVRMRKEIIRLGGEVRFRSCVTEVLMADEKVTGVIVNDKEKLVCSQLILALGHSARDTFAMLLEKGFAMQPKAFAIGLRIEHPADMIQKDRYGDSKLARQLPAAPYKLTHHAENGRGVYSFCMCPGGFVVNASSRDGMTVVNGMSNYDRRERNSNSAIVVTVTPEDFEEEDVMAGVRFQERWERAAYEAGHGKVPVQTYGDYCENKPSTALGEVIPNIKGQYQLTNLRSCLPEYVNDAIIEGVHAFEKQIRGFSRPDAVLSGVETRTSSPVRIQRDETFQSNITGVYPCGEGAGYAGGIVSAAMDGIKVAEAVVMNRQ
ncbi:MAG: NAD(P)/FAD-dependent oxidoreductase [Lachnospiraceae bacterium]